MKKFKINPKELEKEIDAEKLAIADAKHKIPPSDSKTPGASESKIRMISSESLMETVSKINKSGSYLQRKLQIGYNRAARIMEMMEKEGIVGQANHVGKREII